METLAPSVQELLLATVTAPPMGSEPVTLVVPVPGFAVVSAPGFAVALALPMAERLAVSVIPTKRLACHPIAPAEQWVVEIGHD